MTMKNETLIIENLKTLSKEVREVRAIVPNIAKIEEHLKNLNGSVQSQKEDLKVLDTRCDRQDRRIDKIYNIAGVISTGITLFVGTIIAIISKMLK